MDRYASLDDVIRDRKLNFVTDDNSRAGIQRAVERRLRELQAESAEETSEEYHGLVEAREFLARPGQDVPPTSTDLVRLTPKSLERLVELAADTGGRAAPKAEPAEVRMTAHRTATATKASADFRYGRTLPIGAGATLVVWLISTRESFGVDTPQVSQGFWAAFAVAVVAIGLMLYLLATRQQRHAESILRGLYSPDIQGQALHAAFEREDETQEDVDARQHLRYNSNQPNDLLESAITRSSFRHYLVAEAVDRQRPYGGHGLIALVPSLSLSTVDLSGAAQDAAGLALERLTEMGVLTVTNGAGIDYFTFVQAPPIRG